MFKTTRKYIPNKMLHKLTIFIPNIMFNTVNQFLFEYCLCIKENSIWLLLIRNCNRQTEQTENAENLSYPSTEHAVNKINYLHTEKIDI